MSSERRADRPVVDQALEMARSALGADAFAAVWGERQAMTLEQVISYALTNAGPKAMERTSDV